MTFDDRTFRKAMGFFPTGVTVATTLSGEGHPVGVTISSFSSLSLSPPLVLFCLALTSSAIDSFKASGFFAINVLSAEQKDLSNLFACKGDSKWSNVAYESWETGAPIIPGSLAAFDCRLVDVHDGGDHLIFIGRVERLSHLEDGAALLYYRGAYGKFEHPKA